MSRSLPIFRARVKQGIFRLSVSGISGTLVFVLFLSITDTGPTGFLRRIGSEALAILPIPRSQRIDVEKNLGKVRYETPRFADDLMASLLAFLVGFAGAFALLRRAESDSEGEIQKGEYISGQREVTPAQALKEMERNARDPLWAFDYQKSPHDLTIKPFQMKETVTIPEGLGAGHMIMLGLSGRGKSRLIFSYLSQIRTFGGKCIIIDPNGHYYSAFGQPDDRILSIFDKRGEPYSFWGEDGLDYYSIASSLIETRHGTGGQEFFSESPQSLLAGLLRISKDGGLEELKKHIYEPDVEYLQKALAEKTEVSGAFLKDSRLAANVMASLAVKLYWLKYLNYWPGKAGKSKAFSIGQWVRDDKDPSWLFLVADDRDWDASYHVLRMWFDLSARLCLGRGRQQGRRPVYAVADEIATIGALGQFTHILNKGRKDGFKLIAGLQNISQFREIYGADGAQTILDAFQIKFLFATESDELCGYMAKATGSGLWLKRNEQISPEGDSSASSNTEKRYAVLEHVFPQLRPGEFVVKITGVNPFRIAIEHQDYPSRQPGSVREVPPI